METDHYNILDRIANSLERIANKLDKIEENANFDGYIEYLKKNG